MEVEQAYGTRKPDFTVAYQEDEGVIECKSLQSMATVAIHLTPDDALVYLMHSLELLPFHITFDALPSDEARVYNMVSDVLAWVSSDEIQSMGSDTRHKILPSGYGATVKRGTGWSVLGLPGSLHTTTRQQQKFWADLLTKRSQVQHHDGYNCVLLDVSFYPAFVLPPNIQPLISYWFAQEDPDGVVDAVLITGMNVPGGILMPNPTMWPNPRAKSLNTIHARLSDLPTVTWERFLRGDF